MGKHYTKRRITSNIQFDDYGKTYCYLTDDDTLEAGDYVVVSVGKDNRETNRTEIYSVRLY